MRLNFNLKFKLRNVKLKKILYKSLNSLIKLINPTINTRRIRLQNMIAKTCEFQISIILTPYYIYLIIKIKNH